MNLPCEEDVVHGVEEVDEEGVVLGRRLIDGDDVIQVIKHFCHDRSFVCQNCKV